MNKRQRKKRMTSDRWRHDRERGKRMKTIEQCCEFSWDIENGLDPERIEKRWEKVFRMICKHWLLLEPEVCRLLFDQLVQGNWERLHLTEEERDLPWTHWAQEMAHQLFYCSDRWSLDRLTRIHWLYRQMMRAKRMEKNHE